MYTLTMESPIRDEIAEAFADVEAWNAFVQERPHLRSRQYIEEIAAHARAHGLISSFFGPVTSEEVVIGGPNYREDLVARGLNSRCRAVLELLAAEPFFHKRDARIYAAEACTPFALALRGRYMRFVGSEFVSTERAREELFPIEFQDLTRLTFPAGRFDCVITNDCLEHIPRISACLGEMARVLRPGGVMLSTFPFTFRQEGHVKARMNNGEVEYLTEPEYHGNPAEPEKGSLVFEIPGWNILDTARASGFARAEIVCVSSFEKAIIGAETAVIMVMRCYK